MTNTHVEKNIFFCQHSSEIIIKDDSFALSDHTLFIYDLAQPQSPVASADTIQDYVDLLTPAENSNLRPYPKYLIGLLKAAGAVDFEVIQIDTGMASYLFAVTKSGKTVNSLPWCPLLPYTRTDEEEVNSFRNLEHIDGVEIEADDPLNEDQEEEFLINQYDIDFGWDSCLEVGEFYESQNVENCSFCSDSLEMQFKSLTKELNLDVVHYIGSLFLDGKMSGFEGEKLERHSSLTSV